MIEFLKSLFRPAPPSGSMAKERLRLVLLSDHLSLAPDVVDALKKDLLAVISRYVTIDTTHADVTFEHRENEVAMLANIPITGLRDRTESVAAAPPPIEPELVRARAEDAPEPKPAETTVVSGKSAQRRRRRKKATGNVPVQPGYSAQA